MGILDSIGALIPGNEEPAQQSNLGAKMPAAPASGGGSWTDLLKSVDPNFLKSAGAQLMVGSPGGLMNQFGPAVAKGFEGENLSEQENHARATQQQAVGLKEAEGAANRASHEKIASESNDTKHLIAQEKIAGMIERAGLIHGPQGPAEMKMFLDAKNKYMHDEANRELLSRLSRAQQEEAASAYAKTSIQQAREASGVRSQGSPLGTGPEAGASSAPPASGTGAGAATVPGAKAPTAGQGTPSSVDISLFPPRAIFGEANVLFNQKLKDPKYGAQFKDLLKTPEGRAQIIDANPKLKDVVEKNWEYYSR